MGTGVLSAQRRGTLPPPGLSHGPRAVAEPRAARGPGEARGTTVGGRVSSAWERPHGGGRTKCARLPRGLGRRGAAGRRAANAGRELTCSGHRLQEAEVALTVVLGDPYALQGHGHVHLQRDCLGQRHERAAVLVEGLARDPVAQHQGLRRRGPGPGAGSPGAGFPRGRAQVQLGPGRRHPRAGAAREQRPAHRRPTPPRVCPRESRRGRVVLPPEPANWDWAPAAGVRGALGARELARSLGLRRSASDCGRREGDSSRVHTGLRPAFRRGARGGEGPLVAKLENPCRDAHCQGCKGRAERAHVVGGDGPPRTPLATPASPGRSSASLATPAEAEVRLAGALLSEGTRRWPCGTAVLACAKRPALDSLKGSVLKPEYTLPIPATHTLSPPLSVPVPLGMLRRISSRSLISNATVLRSPLYRHLGYHPLRGLSILTRLRAQEYRRYKKKARGGHPLKSQVGHEGVRALSLAQSPQGWGGGKLGFENAWEERSEQGLQESCRESCG